MKRTYAAAAIAGLLGLTGCTSSSTAKETSSAPVTAAATASAASPVESAAATGVRTVKEACETFNSLYAEFAAVSVDNENGYEDIYMKVQGAQGTVPGNLVGLFASLSIIALDRASAASDGGQIEQASRDAVRDAVFANASACTAEGVTLQL